MIAMHDRMIAHRMHDRMIAHRTGITISPELTEEMDHGHAC